MKDYYRERGMDEATSPKKRPAKYPKSLKKLLKARAGAKVRNQLLDLPAGTRVRKVSGGAVELGKKR
jgi:hypothetical protein